MEKKRSIGVKNFGNLNKAFGYFGLLFYLIGCSPGVCLLFAKDKIPAGAIFYVFFNILIPILISVAFLITGDGILQLKEKVRRYTIYLGFFLSEFIILNSFYSWTSYSIYYNIYFLRNPICFYYLWIILIYSLLLIYFFTRPNVKEQFK